MRVCFVCVRVYVRACVLMYVKDKLSVSGSSSWAKILQRTWERRGGGRITNAYFQCFVHELLGQICEDKDARVTTSVNKPENNLFLSQSQ